MMNHKARASSYCSCIMRYEYAVELSAVNSNELSPHQWKILHTGLEKLV